MRKKRSMGVRSRIFLYFLMFTALLLIILWLLQIVLLDDFYRMQMVDMLKSSSESIVRNIDNEDLQSLVDRIAEQNSVCVLITTEKMEWIAAAEALPGCIIHHMSVRDLERYMRMAATKEEIQVKTFPMVGFRNSRYDEKNFVGYVPPSDDGQESSMVTVQRASLADGKMVYVFLNSLVTPVTGTIRTIRGELYFITAIMILLAFLLSLVLSRRITRPLVETTEAARELSHAQYSPVKDAGYREIVQLNAQLTQTADDLRRVEEMQRELIANISHDLRTPLTLIEGYAEAMRDLPDENTPENMQVIIDETKRLNTLVNAVLDLNAARRGGDEAERTRFELTETIRAIINRYAKLIEQDGYQIVFEPMREVTVSADEIKVQQVIYNLINNALTYTGEDKTVTVRQKVSGDRVRIEVSDSGEGIAPDDLPYIWDRYYRGGKPHKRAAIGSGLGLSIVKEILENYGFPYGAESTVGKGSTFWFEMNVENQWNGTKDSEKAGGAEENKSKMTDFEKHSDC